MSSHIELKTNQILDLYQKHGQELYFGENVTQLQHALQAAELAKAKKSDDETILAAFLHDIGHICLEETEPHLWMDSYGAVDHETLGADFLRKIGFSQKVCRLVASHVAAKRYLTSVDQEYYEKLSEASKKTLEFQGGIMSPDEVSQFSNEELFTQFIQLRKWDEEAKSEIPVPENMSFIKNLIIQHLTNQYQNQ
jgi:2-amino-1-hydroxyethylphosphonate dioxygenase (glycine-forming)